MPRRQSRGRRVKTGAIRQLDFQLVRNPYRPMNVLTEEQEETIHSRSLDLLESFGINFLLPEAREVLGKAGAILDPDSPRVRFDREMLMQVVSTTPSQFTMRARNHAHDLIVGGDPLLAPM